MVPPRGPQKANISPEEDWNFPSKSCQKLVCFRITKIRLGEKYNIDSTESNTIKQSNKKSC